MSLVVDASAALATVLPDEDSAYARAAVALASREGLVVPALWPYEIQSGLATALRRGRIGADSVQQALDALRELRAQLEAPQGLGQELRLAQAHGLTPYDAAYLGVALNMGKMLATNDLQLRRAAESLGVVLFAEPSSKPKPPRRRG
ncbi:MAG: type II toxin-antitoxin system VapC family toxin [Vulcanimicrobiaceae bacterium]